MSADVLRKVAALMRERAAAATPGPWARTGFEYDDAADSFTYDVGTLGTHGSAGYTDRVEDAEHIASWHPTVALAVADWLDMCAGMVVNYGPNAESPWVKPHTQMALAVATAYLGSDG